MVVGYFGLPGSGKTTFLTRIAQKELKRMKKGKSKYKHILTNFYCDGCEKIQYSYLGNYEIEVKNSSTLSVKYKTSYPLSRTFSI